MLLLSVIYGTVYVSTHGFMTVMHDGNVSVISTISRFDGLMANHDRKLVFSQVISGAPQAYAVVYGPDLYREDQLLSSVHMQAAAVSKT